MIHTPTEPCHMLAKPGLVVLLNRPQDESFLFWPEKELRKFKATGYFV